MAKSHRPSMRELTLTEEMKALGEVFTRSRVREYTRRFPRRKRFKHTCPMGCNEGKKRGKQVELHREYIFRPNIVAWVIWLRCERCGAVYRYNHQRGFRKWDTLCNRKGWELARYEGKRFPAVKVPTGTNERDRSGKSKACKP
jgi:hypothetical protein